MNHISSHTINQKLDFEAIFYSELVKKILAGETYVTIFRTFDKYYGIAKEALAYYQKKGDYEACTILRNNLDMYIDNIPTSIEEAIKGMIEEVDGNNMVIFEKLPQMETYSVAINLHHSLGLGLIDRWLLRNEDSPLRQYITQKHQITNPDEMANKIITTYINALKATLEQ